MTFKPRSISRSSILQTMKNHIKNRDLCCNSIKISSSNEIERRIVAMKIFPIRMKRKFKFHSQPKKQTNLESQDVITLITKSRYPAIKENVPGYPLNANGFSIAITAVSFVNRRSLRKHMQF